MNLDIRHSLRNLSYSKLQKSLAEPEFFDSLAKVLGKGLTKAEFVDIFLDYKLYDLLNDKDLRWELLSNNIEMVDHLLVGTKLEDSSDISAKIDLILDTKWGHNNISKNWLRVYDLSEEFLPKTSQKEPSRYTISAKRSLFPYQKNLKNSIVNILLGEDDRLLIHMPTGAGKTRTTIEALVDYWRVKGESGNYLIWLADSEELCGQAEETFKELWELKGDSDLQLYKLWGSNNMSELSSEGGVIIASLQKLYNLMKSPKNESSRLLNHIGGRSQIVIVDEAHKSMADTYAMAIERVCVVNETKLLGLTATPGRTSIDEIEGLVSFYGNNKITLSDENGSEIGNPIEYLQDNDYLSQFERIIVRSNSELDITASEEQKISELLQIPANLLKKISADEKRNILIIDEIVKLAEEGLQIMVFACSVEHSRFLSTAISLKGYESCSIDGETPKSNRAEYIRKFKNNEMQVLVNFGILSTGFDAPNTNAVVIARPTCSLVLYSQMVGRGLRGPKMGGTKDCKIIDIKDNFDAFDSVHDAFKFYDDFWS